MKSQILVYQCTLGQFPQCMSYIGCLAMVTFQEEQMDMCMNMFTYFFKTLKTLKKKHLGQILNLKKCLFL